MRRSISVNGERFEMLISEARILRKVRELAHRISMDYGGRIPVFIGVLNGSFIFFADLIREVTIDCEVDFLKLSSYGDAKISSGAVRLLKDLNCQVEGRDIIIVEDIVDTGLTIAHLLDLLKTRRPRSIRVCSLLHKPARSRVQVSIDFLGFTIEDKFVVGYGLDWAQRYRNLPYIGLVVRD